MLATLTTPVRESMVIPAGGLFKVYVIVSVPPTAWKASELRVTPFVVEIFEPAVSTTVSATMIVTVIEVDTPRASVAVIDSR